jgi:hypothetical protein
VKGTEKAYDKTAEGTRKPPETVRARKAYDKTAEGTKKATQETVKGTEKAADKTAEGTRRPPTRSQESRVAFALGRAGKAAGYLVTSVCCLPSAVACSIVVR